MLTKNTKKILEVAKGQAKADLLIKNVNLVNVFTHEIEKADISVSHGIIARVGLSGSGSCKYDANEVIDGTGKYLIPGLLDAHTHIEMSFMSAVPFAEAVIPQGTTGAILDMHDIGNVSMEALRWFAQEIKTTPLKAYLMIPPCVPSSPGQEDSGVVMDLEQLQKAMSIPGAFGLGETMDFNRVVSEEDELMSMLSWAKEQGYPIDGHCPELRGDSLQAYVAAGVSSDHESVSLEEMLEKYRLGMKIVLRRGSLDEPVRAGDFINSLKDTSNVLLATDGCIQLDTIINQGTMITALRDMVKEGVDPITAVQLGTINVARSYGLHNKIGVVAPGRDADMVLVSDLKDFRIISVFVNGKKIPPAGQYELPRFKYPETVLNTVKLDAVEKDFFKIPSPVQNGQVNVRVIGVSETSLITEERHVNVEASNGEIHADTSRDILKISVLDRYKSGGRATTALVSGFGFKKGALAGTIGQDSQNLIVVGAVESDMALAVNTLREIQGGIVYVVDGKVMAKVELPLGGIMNYKMKPQEILKEFNALSECVKKESGLFNNPSFPLAFMLTCPVIPELKITNCGLIDALSGNKVPLFVD